MIPVMIVDDEFIVRVGMRSMVDWNKYGYEVVAEASNGQEGLAQFRKYRPRLIFCDINMPDMSGLEMLEEIRKIDQDVACVILTAYQEFSYAQQAIRLGTTEYVIKATMLTEDIVSLLKRLYSRLALEEAPDAERETRRQEKEALFAALQAACAEAALPLLHRRFPSASRYDLLYARMPDDYADASDPRSIHTVRVILRDVLREQGLNTAVISQGNAYWILAADADRCSLYNAIQRTLNGVRSYLPAGLRIGVAEELDENDLVRCGCERALYAYESHALYSEDAGYIVYESAQGDAAAAKEEVNRRVQQINRSLLVLDLPTAKQETESLFSEVVTPTGSLEIQHIAVVGLLGALAQYLPLDEKRELTRRSDLLAWFFAHIDQIGVAREGVTPSRLHVENAKAYIRSHYHKPISLKNVAAELAISQNYLSKIFYKETGRHITDFIADEKITRACELLRTTAEPVSVIAEELGFVDQAYFTKRFKMKMGISPNGYRKKHTAP